MNRKYSGSFKVNSFFFFLMIITGACVPVKENLTSKNVASIYNPSSSNLHPKYKLYHNSDTSSQLYIKIYPQELLFNKANEKNELQGKMALHYNIYNSFDEGVIIDSSTTYLTLNKRKINQPLTTYLSIRTMPLQKSLMVVSAVDLLSENTRRDILQIQRNSNFNEDNFIVKNTKSNLPIFENYVGMKDHFYINHRNKFDYCKINYFGKRLPLPPPPFTEKNMDTLNLKPDSIWIVPFLDNTLNQPYEGFYFYQPDSANYHGLMLATFHKHFPYSKRPLQLIEPLQYITSRREFDEILSKDNQKIAVDDFWLNAAGDMETAREIIRIFYNRVLLTNLYFTNITEGWRTDRGMVYIIFGPPMNVFKTASSETWVYSDTNNYQTISFTFVKIKNPYTDKYYILRRNIIYKSPWYRAVDSWRKGRVYSIGN